MKLTPVFVGLSLLFSVVVCAQRPYRLVCYMSSWAQYRSGIARFTPDKADPFLCTHIIYAFADINDSHDIVPQSQEDKIHYISLNALKRRNPALKTLLSVGGWDPTDTRFINMASNHTHRQMFIESALRFLRLEGFDGLDVVWQNPADATGIHRNKNHFTHLLKELRGAILAEAQLSGREPLLLSTAVSGIEEYARATYNPHTFPRHVDFITMMTYDFHGPWQGVTGHISPLYSQRRHLLDRPFSIHHAVKYWLSRKVDPWKLTLGFPAYSRTFWTSRNATTHGVGDPAKEGQPGKYTQTPGFMAAYEVCQFIRSGAVVVFDKTQRVPYAYKGDQWLGFDNAHSIREKTTWLKRMGLGGAMIWSLDLDDFSGALCNQGKFPLTHLLKASLMSQDTVPQHHTRHRGKHSHHSHHRHNRHNRHNHHNHRHHHHHHHHHHGNQLTASHSPSRRGHDQHATPHQSHGKTLRSTPFPLNIK